MFFRNITEMKKILFFIVLAFSTILSSCDDYEYADVVFVGDGHLAGWDLKSYFPEWNAENYGKNYFMLEHLVELKGKFNNKSIVVLLGAHDPFVYQELDPMFVESYSSKFVDAVSNIGKNNTIYLFPILPRRYDPNSTLPEYDAKNVTKWANMNIEAINSNIKARAKQLGWNYVDVYDSFLEDGVLAEKYSKDGLSLTTDAFNLLSASLRNSFK